MGDAIGRMLTFAVEQDQTPEEAEAELREAGVDVDGFLRRARARRKEAIPMTQEQLPTVDLDAVDMAEEQLRFTVTAPGGTKKKTLAIPARLFVPFGDRLVVAQVVNWATKKDPYLVGGIFGAPSIIAEAFEDESELADVIWTTDKPLQVTVELDDVGTAAAEHAQFREALQQHVHARFLAAPDKTKALNEAEAPLHLLPARRDDALRRVFLLAAKQAELLAPIDPERLLKVLCGATTDASAAELVACMTELRDAVEAVRKIESEAG